jgi:FMN phosphatase YigB (HAD superfamily)
MGEMGYRRYILSNVDEDLLKVTIERNGLDVDGYVTAEEIHSYKPAPRHWESFVSRTGARISDDLHVAQSIFHDIRPAQGLGFATAWVNRYHESLVPDVHPDYICQSLSDLVKILQR